MEVRIVIEYVKKFLEHRLGELDSGRTPRLEGCGLGSGLVCARLGRYLMFFSTLIVIDSG